MQIVLFLDLFFDLLVNIQAHDERVALARGGGRVGVDESKRFMQLPHRLASGIDFLVHGVAKIPGETPDFLGFLLQVIPETHQLADHLVFHLSRLCRLQIALSVKVPQNVGRISQTSGFEERGRKGTVVQDVRCRHVQFGTSFVGLLDFLEKDDQVFEGFAPRCKAC